MTTSDAETRNALLKLICDQLDGNVAQVASDAICDLLQDSPDDALALLSPIAYVSNYWLEQLARAACDLRSDHIDDLECVLEECLARSSDP